MLFPLAARHGKRGTRQPITGALVSFGTRTVDNHNWITNDRHARETCPKLTTESEAATDLRRRLAPFVLAALAATALSGACASTRTLAPGEAPNGDGTRNDDKQEAEPAPRTLEEAVARATRARAEADALKPPVYSGPRDVESLTRFMNTEFKAWTAEKNLAASKATRAYAVAANLAPAGTQIELRLGFAEMWLDYADEFISTGEAAIPDTWRRHPSIVASYRDNLRQTTQAHVDVARIALEQCVVTAEQQGLDSAAAKRCSDRLVELERTAAKEDAPPYRPRPFEATHQPSPCVFRGTLHGLGMRLFADETGSEELARLDRAEVEVHLSATADGRAHARVLWPIQAEGYLDQYPFETTRRVDAVPKHVWLPPGTAVNAHAKQETSATIKIAFSTPDGPQHSPATFSGEVTCDELALRGPLRAGGTTPSRDDLVLRTGKVNLYDQPGGKIVASVTARGDVATPVEYRDDWTRVRLNWPFHADAWIKSSALRERESDSVGLIGLRTVDHGRVTHVTTEPIALRLEPRVRAKANDRDNDRDNDRGAEGSQLVLVPGAGLEVGATRGVFVEVRPRGIRRADGAPYYVLATDLDTKTARVRG